MIYRIAGSIFFILAALSYFGLAAVPLIVIGVFALAAGIALLAGA